MLASVSTLDGFSAGQTATLQVRVWDRALFPDFDAPVQGGGIYGQSIPFSYTVPTVIIRGDEVWMHNFQGFTLIPEPSTYVLLALGGAIVYQCVRRKRRAIAINDTESGLHKRFYRIQKQRN